MTKTSRNRDRAEVMSHTPTYRNQRQYALGQISVEVPPTDAVIELQAYNANGASDPARFVMNRKGVQDLPAIPACESRRPQVSEESLRC